MISSIFLKTLLLISSYISSHTEFKSCFWSSLRSCKLIPVSLSNSCSLPLMMMTSPPSLIGDISASCLFNWLARIEITLFDLILGFVLVFNNPQASLVYGRKEYCCCLQMQRHQDSHSNSASYAQWESWWCCISKYRLLMNIYGHG